jgi:predicted RNase H-like HicB family nuclease
MEAAIMACEYNLSLIFYPQREGGYTVICPELRSCIAEGKTIDEATANINNVIADFLPDEVKSEANEEVFREGLCMEGKLYQEIKVVLDDAGEARFPGARAYHVA